MQIIANHKVLGIQLSSVFFSSLLIAGKDKWGDRLGQKKLLLLDISYQDG